MATIQTSLRLHDGMTAGMKSIKNALDITIGSFETLQNVSSNAIDSNSIKTAREELNKAQYAFDNVEREIKEADAAQRNFNDNIRNGQVAADGLSRKIKMIAGTLIGIAGIRKGISAIGDWLGLADVQIASERQLATVMANMGATKDEFESIKKTASNIQLDTTFGDEALLGGAAELATYLNSGDAVEAMMGTLANYAAGMGGMDVNKAGMVEYATQLGKALDGQFDGLRKKGFDVTDAQKAIIEHGTEMERVAVITDIIDQSWAGLSETLAKTPQGQILQMKNTWGDIKETVGNHLYPAVLRFFQTLNSNLPQAESMMMGLAGALIVVIDFMTNALNVATAVSGFFVDNWSLIAPIIYGIAGALSVYYGAALMGAAATGILKAAKMLAVPVYAALTGATMANTAAQWGLNKAMYANPIVWVIILVVALIAIFYAAVAAVNKFAGTSVSATGIIMGAFAVAGAFLYNSFVVPLWNGFATLANFFANVFNDPVASIKILFLDMAKTVIGYISTMASAIEKVINKIPGVTVDMTSGLDNIYSKIEAASQKIKNESEWVEVVGRLDYKQYDKAFQAGYSAGENFDSRFSLGNILDSASNSLSAYEMGNTLDGIYNGVDDTAMNTASMKDSMQGSEETLKYMRDIAEKEAVNRFTTAELTLNLNNTFGDIHEKADLDGIVTYLEEKFMEALEVGAEGVHK
ncbi:hypothetical protein HYG86_11410 [Alkalicella caledoniensis]|uniref:Phage tail tape measure protein n=1 Tax=Alkalicella caledoniensis TaxID=2731377 RepID=A0A7G9W9G8_ALKCA|nr:hypothetical protein [Alkalicella caledoniensis]QNO15330.1 hypothetical protein HYG86_11410 [Alkalicella caledoniensis]